MKLSDLLISVNVVYKGKDEEINFITDDSRKCIDKSIFVCHDNAKQFVTQAIENGAVAVVAKEKLCENCITVDDTRKAYAQLCRSYFSKPDEKLKLIAVTGTNGKTSVTAMTNFILEMSGRKSGLIGTVVNKIDGEQESEMTTPDCFSLYQMLSRLVESKAEYCVIEASSQGLAQQRLYGLQFEVGVFTNLTEDHLDYHKTFENYKNAKLSLFENCKSAVINFDDEHSADFAKKCSGRVITFSAKSDDADFTAKNIRCLPDSTVYALVANSLIHTFRLNLQGDFWVKNSIAAIITCVQLGINLDECSIALKSFSGVKGRMELVETNLPFKVIIDYAHTADGLRTVLMSLKRFCSGRLIAVFGCGGDRETQKRSEMGMTAATLADIAVITTDNPRTENPQKIIDDILVGMKKSRIPVYIKTDRRDAIAFALKLGRKDDIILLAGKGHETTQIIGTERYPFDERKIVAELAK
ncbi:MAG: UDP-N-acetylmuramoyl-L-alanyl-D-glutamate--2,6-diaminopimelate ligase [Faecalibacterium sp.]|nr:UDP-N-acetylmuramoyl-L-alanyl-D-glutamate--2,6-diaminopimelate ligase [Ruminococcus sp.]MCM1392863.1 UDP-N-acetylmuramoyl-L-alanyl-D-glutamate--2,6-diaminopimelate ligase [Ruminococcus sp.]MCM1485420.1 UDP-N-acetylmuramoyl-L-alanyl-D-glutamate--2,6-diaminopimelate ligase [Faecalibacterium sp.]